MNQVSSRPAFESLLHLSQCKIAVIGLGYVGLPLAIELAKKYYVVGFDIDPDRVSKLQASNDITGQIEAVELQQLLNDSESRSNGLQISADEHLLKGVDIFIITVPTPIDKLKAPDLRPLLAASAMIGRALKKGSLVIYESTVYPGCTEEDCVPVLEKESKLKFNEDFWVGYSPERINPGDKVNVLTTIRKVVSGSTPQAAEVVEKLYASIIPAGTYKANSLKIAEAAKAIENAQRDLNISFVNELALIFDRMGIDTNDVLDAAGTKWNFLKFRPGLVGGHCIGVDPYYLANKAESLGYYPQVILSGRRVNDNMGTFVANKVVKLLIRRNYRIVGLKALILGITFKENCPDIRNTRVIDIYHELVQFGMQVDVVDPWANKEEVKAALGIDLVDEPQTGYHAVVLAVAHSQFKEMMVRDICADQSSVIFDTKAFLPREMVDCRL
jgi:UDP-N-acetyl-D-galactosamine dehydrogenase